VTNTVIQFEELKSLRGAAREKTADNATVEYRFSDTWRKPFLDIRKGGPHEGAMVESRMRCTMCCYEWSARFPGDSSAPL
jgi:hypothetical protein